MMTYPISRAGGFLKAIFWPSMAMAMEMGAGGAGAAPPITDIVELRSPYAFVPTLARVTSALEGAGLTIFARIDHGAAAKQVGLDMPPTTVLVYGNPRGGTPLMLAAPLLALDLPLRILVPDDGSGHALVSFHDARTLTRAAGLPDDAAVNLEKSAAIVAAALAP
jgi:uncharacterized protein (DUF302 family)